MFVGYQINKYIFKEFYKIQKTILNGPQVTKHSKISYVFNNNNNNNNSLFIQSCCVLQCTIFVIYFVWLAQKHNQYQANNNNNSVTTKMKNHFVDNSIYGFLKVYKSKINCKCSHRFFDFSRTFVSTHKYILLCKM